MPDREIETIQPADFGSCQPKIQNETKMPIASAPVMTWRLLLAAWRANCFAPSDSAISTDNAIKGTVADTF